MSRRALPVLALTLLLAAATTGAAKPGDDKPPKPKPPQVELLTRSQEAALRQGRIKVEVESEQGRRTRVEAELVVEGIPDDFHLPFPAQRKRLQSGAAKVTFRLNRRQEEVLAFGEQACMRADVNAQAKVGKRASTIHEQLAKPAGC